MMKQSEGSLGDFKNVIEGISNSMCNKLSMESSLEERSC